MYLTLRHYALILSIGMVILFFNLGAARLWDRDEPRNAGCAAEMLARQDWVTPYFNGELRTHKPVLTYWFMMTAYAVFGQNEFSARFWSAVLGLGTVLLTYHLGRRLFNATAGLWAALALVTSLMFDVASRAATPDAPLIFFSTLAIAAYVLGTFPAREETDEQDAGGTSLSPRLSPEELAEGTAPPSWWTIGLMYAAMGMAVLAKGPVGVVLPMAVIGAFLLLARTPAIDLWEPEESPGKSDGAKRGKPQPSEAAAAEADEPGLWGHALRCLYYAGRLTAPLHLLRSQLAARPFLGLLIVLAIALPWYVWVGLRTEGAWLRGFLWEHNFERAIEAKEGHSGNIFYYPLAILCGFFPWSALAAPLAIVTWNRMRQIDAWHWGYLLAACWIAAYVGAFTIASTKLPSYVTPCYPALALLVGAFVARFLEGEELAESWWPRLSFGSMALVGVVLVIALPIAAARYLPGDEWIGALGAIPILGGIVGLICYERNARLGAMVTMAVTACGLSLALFGWAAVEADGHQEFDQILAVLKQQTDAPKLKSFTRLEASWVYYSGQSIREAEDASQAAAFLASDPAAYLLTTDEGFARLKYTLPAGVSVVAKTRYFLRKGNLILVGRDHAQLAKKGQGAVEKR